METSAISNNNELRLDTTINNGYLKSANKYLPSTAPTDSAFVRPRVIQWDPHMGTDQSTISVVLEQAISDANEEVRPMKLVFGHLVVETNQQQQRAPTASPISSNSNGNLIWITLVARVPRFSDTHVESSSNSMTHQVPLSVCVYDLLNKDTATDHWNFGVFTYKKAAAELKQEYNNSIQKKRSASVEDMLSYPSSTKRSNTNTTTALEDDQLFNQLLAPFEDSPGASNNNTPTSLEHRTQQQQQPLLAPQPANPASVLNQIPNQQQQHSYQPPTSGGSYYGFSDYGQHHQHHPSLLANIQPNPTSGSSNAFSAPATPYTSSMPYQSYQNSTSGSYSMPVTSGGNTSSIYSGYGSMQHQPPQAQPMINASQQNPPQQIMMNNTNNNVHPFAGVLSKANLKITGDLAEMTFNWTQDEWTNGRRLVEFWRRQGGEDEEKVKRESEDETISEVECGFKPIEQEAYQQQRIRENLAAQKDATIKKKSNPLVVSCIYWQERNDYFITSVDCIYLLEGLIGVQFTVEEKNRIRRNLEGFRPLTVSKCKPECADFFKLIMSFPHPKPRNIEKDVKVFSWKTLPNALKKIIRKYTPSYSSTAVVNLNNN